MNNKFAIFATSVFWIMVILLLRQCNSPDGVNTGNKVVYNTQSDTVYLTKDTTIYKPGSTITIHETDTVTKPGDTIFVADTNYIALKKQYEELAKLYKVRNIYVDSFDIDTLGKLYLTDTLQYNQISGRIYELDYSIPVINTKEISEPKHLFYMGGGLSLAEKKIRQVQVGLLYKPAKKNVFGIHLGAGVDGTLYYGGSAYWLLNNKQTK
jgi:hypothetical protein